MEIHGLIRLLTRGMFQEARASTFNLDPAAALLLNVLDIGTALTNDLGSKVESGYVLHV